MGGELHWGRGLRGGMEGLWYFFRECFWVVI